jgi:phage FluMu protein Com
MTTAVATRVDTALKVWRCRTCGRILTRADLAPGSTVEIKCGCKTVTTISVPRVETTQYAT